MDIAMDFGIAVYSIYAEPATQDEVKKGKNFCTWRFLY